MNTSQKNRLDALYRQFENTNNRFDFKGLYIALEQAAKNMNLNEGEQYVIPLEDRSYFLQKFYKNYSTLDHYNKEKEFMTTIISKEDSVKKEYAFLEGFETGHKSSGLGIGRPYPQDLINTIRRINPGETIMISNTPYVCTKKDNIEITLKPCAGETNQKYRTFKDFQKTDNLKMSLQWAGDYQQFYNDLKAKSKFVEIRVQKDILHRGENHIDSAEAGVDRGHSKNVRIGTEKFTIKKDIFNRCFWYGSNGKKVNKESVVAYAGWLDANPTYIEINDDRNLPAEQKELDKYEVEQTIYNDLVQKNIQNLSSDIIQICNKMGHDFSIDFKSYEKMNAVSYIFRKEKGGVKIYKASYENNDLNANAKKVEPCTINEFSKFCEKRYDEKYQAIYQGRLEEYQNRFLQSLLPEQTKEAIIQKAAHTSTENISKTQSFMNDVLSMDNFSDIREDVNDILNILEEGYDDEYYEEDGFDPADED